MRKHFTSLHYPSSFTNILNSQFGNMVVLSATYNEQKLRFLNLISKDELVILLDRTIRFLRSLGTVSRTLGYDADILATMRKHVLGGDRGERPRELNQSFSSSTG
jgi:hypothetical protein